MEDYNVVKTDFNEIAQLDELKWNHILKGRTNNGFSGGVTLYVFMELVFVE